LDYFGARYLSYAQARFTSADPENGSAYLTDPQSWNAYVYTRNNPLLYIDPDGKRFELSYTAWREGNFTIVVDSISDYGFGIYLRRYAVPSQSSPGSGNIIVNGEVIGTYTRVSFDDFTALQQEFYDQMTAQREATNQLIAVAAGASAAVGAGAGAITWAGGTTVVINGITYTYSQVASLGPAAWARLLALCKLGYQGLQSLYDYLLINYIRFQNYIEELPPLERYIRLDSPHHGWGPHFHLGPFKIGPTFPKNETWQGWWTWFKGLFN
jgi:hypothetical protein